jgi:hypothetical protein
MGECAVPAKAEREGSKVGGVDVYVCEKAVAVAGMAGVDEPRGGGGDGGGDDPGAMNYDEQLDAQFHLHAPLKILAVNLWCPIHLDLC